MIWTYLRLLKKSALPAVFITKNIDKDCTIYESEVKISGSNVFLYKNIMYRR
jgi:hypothetical protein